MDDEWDFYWLRVDNDPASIYLNLALARIAPVKTEINMAYLRVRMLQPRADGLSSSEEYETLASLEDSVIGDLARNSATTYAGRNTSGGNRDFYFYSADPTSFEASVKRTMARNPMYKYEIGGWPDPSWKTYFDFLYPSADDMQRILNRRVNDNLTAHGDNIAKPRTVDHLAYLPTVTAASALRDYLCKQGFDVTELKTEASSITLGFERVDAPEQLDDVVIPIARRVRDLGGDYDGWGCEVIKQQG